MFDGPKYTPPVPIPKAAQIQHVKPAPPQPDYYLMAMHILSEISEHIRPDGVFWPQVLHILVADLESRLLDVSEEDRDTALIKASKNLAIDMLTVVNKKIVHRKASEKISKVVCRVLDEESERLLKQFSNDKKKHTYAYEPTYLLDTNIDEFGGLSQESILSFTLYEFFSMNLLKLDGEELPTDAEQNAGRVQERRKIFSRSFRSLLTWGVIIIIALIVITIFILGLNW